LKERIPGVGLAVLVGLVTAVEHPASADERTLAYHVVVHATQTHALPVPGQGGHEIGVAAFRGLAIFDDGRIANHWYSGSFDFVDGGGQFRGYMLWAFEDGSELRATYRGEAKPAEGGGIAFEGTHSDVTGAGSYEGVTGEGTFAGRRVDNLGDGGDTYYRGTLTLITP
jgi:hypothetical protein